PAPQIAPLEAAGEAQADPRRGLRPVQQAQHQADRGEGEAQRQEEELEEHADHSSARPSARISGSTSPMPSGTTRTSPGSPSLPKTPTSTRRKRRMVAALVRRCRVTRAVV